MGRRRDSSSADGESIVLHPRVLHRLTPLLDFAQYERARFAVGEVFGVKTVFRETRTKGVSINMIFIKRPTSKSTLQEPSESEQFIPDCL